jgi:hypothetical protein
LEGEFQGIRGKIGAGSSAGAGRFTAERLRAQRKTRMGDGRWRMERMGWSIYNLLMRHEWAGFGILESAEQREVACHATMRFALRFTG